MKNDQHDATMKIKVKRGPSIPSSMPQIVLGMVLGIAVMFIAFSVWEYVSRQEIAEDRNKDGKADVIFSYSGGVLRAAKFDDNFDGHFETLQTYDRRGVIMLAEIDRNQDGKPDLIEHYALGKYEFVEFIDQVTGKIKKRVFYTLGAKTREEIDQDGDGKFEKTIQFDQSESSIK